MINYPEVQKKVQAELDRVVGFDRLPRLEDRPKLVYFFAVLKEVMRMRIVSPVLAPHYCSEDVEVGGYTLPRGRSFFIHTLNPLEHIYDKQQVRLCTCTRGNSPRILICGRIRKCSIPIDG